MRSVVLVGLFILIDTGQALTMDWAEKRKWDATRMGEQYVRQTVLVLHSGVAMLSGLAVAAHYNGLPGVFSCLDFALFLKFLPVSVLFTFGVSFKMMAVDHFQAGTIKIFGQLRLPVLALCSTLFLARSYSVLQWQVIMLISVACFAFVSLKGQVRATAGKSWKWTGLAQLLGWVLLNVFGGIVAEHTYKSAPTEAFYKQKVAEDMGHFLTSLLMLFVVVPRFSPKENILDRRLRPGGFFDSWDIRTVSIVVFLFADAWVGNFLLKEFSGVVRAVAKAFSIAAVYLVSLGYSYDRRRSPALSLVALIVVQSTVLFACVR